jgi:NodT family efflux transporter outer membrane factor (OMF) lipoprotein
MATDERRFFCHFAHVAMTTGFRMKGLSAFIRGHLCSSAFLAGIAAVSCLLLTACAVGPNYERPKVATPDKFKEYGDWVVAKPADNVPKGKWWEIFNDPVLGALEEQVNVSNQTLAANEARYRQARAAVREARAAFFPTIGANAGATRSRRGTGTSVTTPSGTVTTGGNSATSYSVGLDAQWEVDLWGRVRRQVEAARAGEAASAADLEAARLSLQAELATNYFQLRVTDVQRELFDDTVKAFRTSLDIANNRYRAGVAAKVDVVQAESQLRSVEAQAIDLRATRAQLENAIAVLVGKPAGDFRIEPTKFQARIPEIPPGVPSTLLERRPDVASAERRVVAANAQVGVAQAAYFPSITLNGSLGYAGGALASLVSAPNRAWSLGLGLADTLLDFGARSGRIEAARGAYDESVANYRETVLVSFQEVENGLASIHWLAEEGQVQQEAARLARESVALTVNQYKAGTVGYLNVVQVQATQLNEERTTVALLGRRLAASVALIRALGGTW